MAKTWDKAKKPVSNGKDIKRFSLTKDLKAGESVKLRMVGDYKARYQYWIKNSEDKFRTVDCLSFDAENEVFVDGAPDPLVGKIGPRGDELKAEFAYAIQAFNEEDELVIVELKKGAFSDIVGLAQNADYGNPSDPENGYIIEIIKEKTGPLKQNIAYKALGGRSNRPLTEEQLKVELYDLDKIYPRPTYDEQVAWLKENTDMLDELDEDVDAALDPGLKFDDEDDLPTGGQKD